MAAAPAPGRTGAPSHQGAVGLLGAAGLQRAAADSGGAPARVVRAGGYPAHCGRAASGQTAPVVASAATGASDPGSGQFLAQYLCRSEERPEGALPQAIP